MAEPSRFLRWSVINQWLQQDRWHQGIEVPSFPPIVTKFTIAASVPSVIYLSIPFHFEFFLMELVEGNICKNTLDLWVQNHIFVQISPSISFGSSSRLFLRGVNSPWFYEPQFRKNSGYNPNQFSVAHNLISSNPIHTQIGRIISYSISFFLIYIYIYNNIYMYIYIYVCM
jgi:hypothetical protein